MSEQEAQQTQTIADKEDFMHGWSFSESIMLPLIDSYGCPHPLKRATKFEQYLYERCRRNESLIDSQAQKIAEQAKALNDCETRNVKLNQQNDKLRDALAEQAERVKQ